MSDGHGGGGGRSLARRNWQHGLSERTACWPGRRARSVQDGTIDGLCRGMDISRHEVLVNGREVGLTRKEFDLLEYLLKH